MNVRRMLRQYAEFGYGPQRGIERLGTRQHHKLRLRFGDAHNWKLDFEAALRKLESRDRVLLIASTASA